MKIWFQSLTRKDLKDLIRPLSEPGERGDKQARYRAKQLFHWVYQRFVSDWNEMTDISKELRAWLMDHVAIYRLTERHTQQAEDGTHKFLWNLADGKTIESVIIPAALAEKTAEEMAAEEMKVGARFAGRKLKGEDQRDLQSDHWRRLTACISSQVGCAMACKFCLTGIQGLDRQLQTHEIVAQIHELRRVAPITNIVFMGMGEPLHNVENIIKACEIFLDQDAFGFSKRKITVSTSGLVTGIEELGKRVDVSLAISLNASNDEQRSAIMPVNKKWNIEALLNECRNFPLGPHRHITFEYVMLKDFNDSLEDAKRVEKLLRGIPAKVNLIPFNEHSGAEFKRPDDARVKAFQKYLINHQLVATVRTSRGRDILAACGQLRSIFGTARGTEKHRDWGKIANAGSAS